MSYMINYSVTASLVLCSLGFPFSLKLSMCVCVCVRLCVLTALVSTAYLAHARCAALAAEYSSLHSSYPLLLLFFLTLWSLVCCV